MPLGLEVDALRVGTLGVEADDIYRWRDVPKMTIYKSGESKEFDRPSIWMGLVLG